MSPNVSGVHHFESLRIRHDASAPGQCQNVKGVVHDESL